MYVCFLFFFYLWAAVLASKIPAPCIQERTGVMPVGSGSSFMVRAPRGRLSWMENIKVSFWELCLHQKQERRRIILLVPNTPKKKAKGPPGLRWRKRGAMRREWSRRGGGHASPKYRVLVQRRVRDPPGFLRGGFRSQPRLRSTLRFRKPAAL